MILRLILIYLFLIISMRLMGKRQLGEMQMSELICAFFLSELATFVLFDREYPLYFGFLLILCLILCEVLISTLAIKFPFVKRRVDFAPTVLIRNGIVSERAMRKNRITIDELLSLLRLSGCFDLKKVNFAILEPNGQLSVVPYENEDGPSRRDLGICVKETGFTVALIRDGRVNYQALSCLGKNVKWLRALLKQYQLGIQDVFLMTSDFLGNVNVFKKGTIKINRSTPRHSPQKCCREEKTHSDNDG